MVARRGPQPDRRRCEDGRAARATAAALPRKRVPCTTLRARVMLEGAIASLEKALARGRLLIDRAGDVAARAVMARDQASCALS